MKYSKNRKLNDVLNAIERDLYGLGHEEIYRYYSDFRSEPDYNIASYGNLLVYFDDVRNLYKQCGYKFADKASDFKIWAIYLRQVGYVVRQILAKKLMIEGVI